MSEGQAPTPDHPVVPEQQIPVVDGSPEGAPVDVVQLSDTTAAEPADNHIEDQDLAWDMAHASKPEREVEALHRAEAKVARGALGIYEAKQQGASDENVQAMREELQPQIGRLKDHRDGSYVNTEYQYSRGVRLSAVEDLALEHKEGSTDKSAASELRFDLENHTDKLAGLFDDRANRVEYWVRALHENPIPEELMKSEQITARGLVGIEVQIISDEQKIEEFTKALEEAGPMAGIEGVKVSLGGSAGNKRQFARPLDVICAAYDIKDGRSVHLLKDIELDKFDWLVERRAAAGIEYSPEGLKQLRAYREAIENPDTTLGQLKDMYTDAFNKAYIEPRRTFIEKNTALIEQIRSGSAGSTAENTETQS